MTETCSLHVADRDPAKLEEIGDMMNITRERIRQIETKALVRVRQRLAVLGINEGHDGGDLVGLFDNPYAWREPD